MFSDKLSFVPSNKFWSEGATGRNKVVAGFVKKATKRNSARGSFLVLSLDFDSEIIQAINDYVNYTKELQNV
jgi:hypothetical protein